MGFLISKRFTIHGRDDGDKVPEVHTIALGADADRAKLQDLAESTGGTYLFAAEPSASPRSTLASPASVAGVGGIELDLAEIYRIVGEAVDNQQQIYSERVIMDLQQTTTVVDVPVDASASELFFTVNWHSILTGATAHLYRPDGVEVTDRLPDSSHYFWHVEDPMAGTWQLTLSCFALEFCADTYLVEAAVKSPITFDVYITPDPAARRQGAPVDILAVLTDEAPILGATVIAQIAAPGGAIYNLPLYDDGLHHDGAADDGLYGNRFTQTFEEGTYVVDTVATGSSNLGISFVRMLTGLQHCGRPGQ